MYLYLSFKRNMLKPLKVAQIPGICHVGSLFFGGDVALYGATHPHPHPRKLDVPSLLDFFVLKLRYWHLEQKKAHLKTCYTPAKTPTVLFSRTYAGWCGLM